MSRDAMRAAAVGYLLIQGVIGYEWLTSGLTKLVHNDFPGGLASDLEERAKDASAWYRHFLDHVVIPHASTFGYLIEITEVAVGVILIGAAVIGLWPRPLRPSLLTAVDALTALAAFAGLVLAVNLTLAGGAGFAPIAPDSFDEGITLDALMVGLQAILLGVSLFTLLGRRRTALQASHQPQGPAAA